MRRAGLFKNYEWAADPEASGRNAKPGIEGNAISGTDQSGLVARRFLVSGSFVFGASGVSDFAFSVGLVAGGSDLGLSADGLGSESSVLGESGVAGSVSAGSAFF
jgi:hypothetical protein